MSSYTYTDHTGDTLRLFTGLAVENRVILIAKGEEDCKEIHIASEDAPTVAAELLKAAGHESVIIPKTYEAVRAREGIKINDEASLSCGTGPEEAWAPADHNPNWLYNKAANYITLAEHIEGKASREAEAEKELQERRDALSFQLNGGGVELLRVPYANRTATMRQAIDRIIELEDGK